MINSLVTILVAVNAGLLTDTSMFDRFIRFYCGYTPPYFQPDNAKQDAEYEFHVNSQRPGP
jgi:hypothetical protein